MTNNLRIKRRFRVERQERGRKVVAKPVREHPVHAPVPRISRLMALAIRFDQLIRDGAVKDQAELAQLGHVSRARLSQILNLTCLAPDIQELILTLPLSGKCRTPISERQLRPIAAEIDWNVQRRLWSGLMIAVF